MELIYSMRRKPLKCEPPHFDRATDTETVRPICTISSANIIAFSSPTELSDVDGDTWGGHVYVCDLDTPWHSYKVASIAHPVSALEWDMEGKQLLIANTVGDVSVYGQKDYLLNDWLCLYSASFPGEHIIKAAFFHNGRRVVTLDKKPDAPITERFQTLRSTPTLKGFGGVPCEGACVVTGTGLLGALFPRGDSVATAAEPLRANRDRVPAASIAYKNGNLLIAASCATGGVRCYLCSVSRPPLPALTIQPLPALYLLGGDVPASVSWWTREEADSLLVAGPGLGPGAAPGLAGPGLAGPGLALWSCAERKLPVHKLLAKGPLQGSTTPGGGQKPGTECFNTVMWQKVGSWSLEGPRAVSACGGGAGAPAGGAGHAVCATPRALHLVARDALVLCSRQVVTSGTPGLAPEAPAAAASPPKKPKYGPGVLPSGAAAATVSHVEVSHHGGVVVCVDTHAQLHVYRLPQPYTDIPSAMSVQHATSLLEYSMVSGYDCQDILMTFKPNIIEPVYERLNETFQRQPPAFQQYYYQSWLKVKIALCRQAAGLQASASALSALQACHAVLAACSAALRDERPDGPPIEDDDDKGLAALEAKPELAPEAAGAAPGLQALRLGLQRALDVALTALAARAHRPHGYDVWSEPASLAVLRKLAGLARGWPRGPELCRLLARPDCSEECVALAAQWSSPRVWESLPRTTVAGPHGRPYPLYLEYGVEPESLRYAPEPPAYAQCDNSPPLAMDSIRYMYLGGGARAARWRACGRCGARALPAPHSQRHPLQRAHDARFLLRCRCGGKWALCKNV